MSEVSRGQDSNLRRAMNFLKSLLRFDRLTDLPSSTSTKKKKLKETPSVTMNRRPRTLRRIIISFLYRLVYLNRGCWSYSITQNSRCKNFKISARQRFIALGTACAVSASW